MGISTFCRAALVAAVAFVGVTSSLDAAPISAGGLVVIRVGDGATTAAGTALPVTLDEFQVTYTGAIPTGVTLVQSIPLLNGAAGTAPLSGQRYLAQGGTAGGEGGLLLSSDGAYMALAGYNAGKGDVTNPGAAGMEDRVVGILDLATGTVDTTTVFSGFSGAGGGGTAARGAYMNGSDVYLAASTGTRYGTAYNNNTGTGTSVGVTNNARRVMVYNGQLYQSEAANSRSGIEMIGTGTPTNTGNAITLLPGFSTTNGTYSIYDFFFADANTLYTADDRNSGTGGLQKWVFNGASWTMAYNLLLSPTGTGTAGVKSLNGYVDGAGNVVLFGSTTGTQQNYLYGFADTLANTSAASVTANKLVSAGTDYSGGALWSLRGVAIAPVPEPATLGMLLIGATALVASRRRA